MGNAETEKRDRPRGWLSGSDSRNKISLKLKIFVMCVSLVSAAVLIFAVLGVIQFSRFAELLSESGSEQDRIVADTTTKTMYNTATGSFQKYVEADAEIIDNEFWLMKHDVEMLSKGVQEILEHPDEYAEKPVSIPLASDKGKLTAQLLFSSDADKGDKEMMSSIRKLANLNDQMSYIVGTSETINDCLIALPGGATLYMDRHPEQKIGDDGKVLPFNSDRRPYYVGAYLTGKTYFAPTNYDYFNDSMEMMLGVPVYVKGRLAAVVAGSRLLSGMEDMIKRMDLSDGSFICLINESGNIIYSQRKNGELAISDQNRGSMLVSPNVELVDFLQKALEGGKGYEQLEIDGESTILAYAPLKTVGWTLLLGISDRELEKPAKDLVKRMDVISNETMAQTGYISKQTQLIIILIAIVLIAFSVFFSLQNADRLVRPIMELKNAGIRFIEREAIEVETAPNYFGSLNLFTGDEIEDLWVTMQDLEINIVTSVRSLKRVTAEKERIDTELSVATKIQSDMLPQIFPAFPERSEFDIYSTMTPAKEVGGDFYDFFLIDDDHLALVMADVSGKGVPAALFMVIAKTIIKNVTLTGKYKGPGEILYDVNNKLYEGNDESMFVTVWLGILTISTGHLVSANGGHEFPAICRKGGQYELIKDEHGPGLGMFDDVDFEEWEGDLKSGDMLFLYTDGVPEATDSQSELFGIDRMLKALDDSREEENLQGMLGKVREHVDSFVGYAPQFDDLTMTIFVDK